MLQQLANATRPITNLPGMKGQALLSLAAPAAGAAFALGYLPATKEVKYAVAAGLVFCALMGMQNVAFAFAPAPAATT